MKCFVTSWNISRTPQNSAKRPKHLETSLNETPNKTHRKPVKPTGTSLKHPNTPGKVLKRLDLLLKPPCKLPHTRLKAFKAAYNPSETPVNLNQEPVKPLKTSWNATKVTFTSLRPLRNFSATLWSFMKLPAFFKTATETFRNRFETPWKTRPRSMLPVFYSLFGGSTALDHGLASNA